MSRPRKTKRKVGLKPTGDARSYSPKKLYENQKTEQERDTNQEPRSLKERYYPANHRELLCFVFLLTGMIVSLIDFFRTGNAETLLRLCYIAIGYGLLKGSSLKEL